MALQGGALRAIKNRMNTPGSWAWLVYVESTDPSDGSKEAFRFTTSDQIVTFGVDDALGDIEWNPAPMQIGEVSDDSTGNLIGFEVTIANVFDSLVAELLERSFLSGERAELTLVNTIALDDAASSISLPCQVGKVSVTERAIRFQFGNEDLYEIVTPQRVITADGCDHAYGGEVCLFPIEELDPGQVLLGPCGKRRSDCRLRGELAQSSGWSPVIWPRQYGAFPGSSVT